MRLDELRQLNELFDSPVKFNRSVNGNHHTEYTFNTTKGSEVIVDFHYQIGEVLYDDVLRAVSFEPHHGFEHIPDQFYEDDALESMFFGDLKHYMLKNIAPCELDFSKNGKQSITDDGDNPYEIFGTVLNIVREEIKNKGSHALYFFADEPSRQKLYRRMCKVLHSRFGYSQDICNHNDDTYMLLPRDEMEKLKAVFKQKLIQYQ